MFKSDRALAGKFSKTISATVLALGVCILSVTASAAGVWPREAFKQFVDVQKNYKIYTEYLPASAGQKTVILLNGLTYSTRQWDQYIEQLQKRGVGVLAMDFKGQGQTLYKYGPALDRINLDDQVVDLVAVLKTLGLTGKHCFVGLSYGGGVLGALANAHPEVIETAISIASFVRPLQGQDITIRSQILATKLMNPLYPWNDDELYDFYLRQNVYATYPYAEPIVLEHPYRLEAAFRLAQGIRKFPSLEAAKSFPKASLHLIIANDDEYVPRVDLEDYWLAVPEEARASKLLIMDSKHKVPETVPEFAAAWTELILHNDSRVQSGHAITAYPKEMKVIIDDSQEVIQLQ